MKITSKRRFEKQLAKLPKKIQKRFIERVNLLISGRESSLLKIHTLRGDKYPLQSMNITGNHRALFLLG